MKKLQALLIAGVAATALAATDAHALIITLGEVEIDSIADVGQSFDVNYSGQVEGDPVPGLTALTTWTYLGITGGDALNFSIYAENTSSAPIDGSRVTAMGFDVDPNVTGVTSEDPFEQIHTPGLLPGLTTVDVCLGGNFQACQAASNPGLELGEFATFNLTLTFSPLPADGRITLGNFGVRYASIETDLQLDSDSGTGPGTPTNGTPVPEPATLALLGIGLLGAGYMARRRRDDA